MTAAAAASAQVTLLAGGGASAKKAVVPKGGVVIEAGTLRPVQHPPRPSCPRPRRRCWRRSTAAALPVPPAAAAHGSVVPPVRWSAPPRTRRRCACARHGATAAAPATPAATARTVGTRTEAAGYRWSTVGENVAAGRATALATLAQWMASPGHCSNIMNPAFTEVAVAGLNLPGTTYNHYWVMVLARPMS
ncbi:MAG: CAP domain-containing protein [Rubrivivax sp.]